MFLNHYRAGTGPLLCTSSDWRATLADLLGELPPEVPICDVAAPGGVVRDVRTGRTEGAPGLAAAYQWVTGAPGRVLLVRNFHVLVNNPGQWEALDEVTPNLRQPKGAGANDYASMVVFVAPCWQLEPVNPLKGQLVMLTTPLPNRAALRIIAERLQPLNGAGDEVPDALGGLTKAMAEQAAAESLVANNCQWKADHLLGSKRQLLREAGLEIWEPVSAVGGLRGVCTFMDEEVVPWVRDPLLSVRRILCYGVPGVGKSFIARLLGWKLKCLIARASIPNCKAGLVGQSEANLRRMLRTVDALAAEAPLVVVFDEIDTIAREGLDGGTSSGMFAELLTWFQESKSQAVVIGTGNRLDKLDAALESRFQARFFFDLPSQMERLGVAKIHYQRLGCEGADSAANITAGHSEGYSSREIAEHICPSVARRSGRQPTAEIISQVCAGFTPASQTQQEQLQKMRTAAGSLRRANDPSDESRPSGRRIGGAK